MADKLFIDFPEKTTFATDDVSIIADSEDAYKVKKIKKSTMKGFVIMMRRKKMSRYVIFN